MQSTFRNSILLLALVPAFALAQEVSSDSGTDAEQTVVAPDAVDEQAVAAESAPPEATPADADDTGAGNGIVGAPQPGMGQVVFFRPPKFAGGAIGFKVREGEVELGKLRSGRYFIASVAPGLHEYTVHSEARDVMTLEVEEGETYYVQGTITMGVLAGRPNLSPSDAAAFDEISGKLKPAK